MRCLFAITAVAALAIVQTGCQSRTETKDKAEANAKPSMSVGAETYFADVKKGGDDAKKYKGVIEIEGTVIGLDADENDRAWITLKGGKEMMDMVMVFTNDKKPWDSVTTGQKIKVAGKVPEFAVFPSLIEATVSHKDGAPTAVTSEALAAEYTKDPKATIKKYEHKGLIVSGEITGKEKRAVTLKGDGKTKVEASFDGFVGKHADPLKVGDSIKINVKFEPALVREDHIGFYIPLLMSK